METKKPKSAVRYLSNRRTVELIIIAVLLVMNFLISEYYRDSIQNVIFNSDDPIHINISKNFLERQKFEVDFTLASTNDVDSLIQKYPVIPSPQDGKGPIYYLFLGSFFGLLRTTTENLFLHASMFNTILTSFFLVIFFFFVRTRFNLFIATVASFLVLAIPFTGYMSARVFLYPLLFTISLAAFFFLEKRNKHYIIFGILAGLAHLTHPFGIYLGFSYVIFLLVKREFKGSIIIFLTWTSLLIPWFIYNYYHFGDIGRGLWIPFADKFSILFLFFPQREDVIHLPPRIGNSIISEGSNLYQPFSVFEKMFTFYFSNLYHIEYLLIFVIAFTGFAFFSMDGLKHKIKYKVIVVGGIIAFYILSSYIDSSPLQIILLFIIPVIFIYLIYKKLGGTLQSPIPRHYQYVLYLTFTNLFGVYFYSILTGHETPDLKLVFFILIMNIPLAILGFHKIIILIRSHINILHKKGILRILLFMIVLSIIILPVIDQTAAGIDSVIEFYHKSKKFENEQIRELNRIILKEIPTDNLVASNQPYITNLKTELKSVGIPITISKPTELEKFIEYYNVSHLIFYDLDTFHGKEIYDSVSEWEPINYYHMDLYTSGSSHVLKVENVENADISVPSPYLAKAMKLERMGQSIDSKKIYEELRNFESGSIKHAESVCTALVIWDRYDDAIVQCNSILKKDPKNLESHYNLVVSYVNKEQREKVHDVLISYNEMLFDEPNNVENLKAWARSITYLSQWGDFVQEYLTNTFTQAKKLEEQHEYQKALILYDRLTYLDETDLQLTIDSFYRKIIILTKLERYEDALNTYDATIPIYNNEIRKLFSSNQYNKANDMQKSMIIVMKAKAALLTNMEDYHEADSVYAIILGYNKFDPYTWQKRGAYFENYDRLAEALHAYEFAHQLEPENDNLLVKIKELKDKIANKRQG